MFWDIRSPKLLASFVKYRPNSERCCGGINETPDLEREIGEAPCYCLVLLFKTFVGCVICRVSIIYYWATQNYCLFKNRHCKKTWKASAASCQMPEGTASQIILCSSPEFQQVIVRGFFSQVFSVRNR